VLSPTESYCSDSYYQALNLGTQLEFKTLYYKYLSNDDIGAKNLNMESLQSGSELLTDRKKLSVDSSTIKINKKVSKLNFYDLINYNFIDKINLKSNPYTVNSFINSEDSSQIKKEFLGYKNYYDYDSLDDLSNFAANIAQYTNNKPIQFVRGILNRHTFELISKTGNSSQLSYFEDKLNSSISYLRGETKTKGLYMPNIVIERDQLTLDQQMY